MKIWCSYGSEHSMNLVMIGHFKSVSDAKKVMDKIDKLTASLNGKVNVGDYGNRYSAEIMEILREINCYSLAPTELEQFFYDTHTDLKENKIILKTEESEISAFLKLMIEGGAKVEVYSAHNYPDSEHGRGK